MQLVLVVVAVAVWAGFTHQQSSNRPASAASSGLSANPSGRAPRTAPLEGFPFLSNPRMNGIWPLMTRPQVLEKLGEPRRRDAQGWEDFGTVQILWSEEPQKSILGMRGHQLLDLQEVVATVGDPLQKVIDRLGLPQELHSDKTGERHLLNYVPNNIRVVAVGKDPAEMGTWRIEQLNWGVGPADHSDLRY